MTHAPLTETMLAQLEASLHEVVTRAQERMGPGLQEMVAYHLGWDGQGAGPKAGGKRIRPLLTLLCCGGVGGDWRGVLGVAAAVELIHNFSLVHDDIQDESPLRRGRQTVWHRWGAGQAINAGDALFALAFTAPLVQIGSSLLAPEARNQILLVLTQACLELTQGQYLDLSAATAQNASVEFYWRMVEAKTGALLRAACQAGGIAGSASADRLASLGEYGRWLGLAFQIQDDVLGLWGDEKATGKSASSDLHSRKKSLPILYGLEHSSGFQRLLAAEVSTATIPKLLQELDACGARPYATARAREMAERAFGALDRAALLPEYDQELRLLTTTLLDRDR